jgi:hypothetical protein
VCERTRNPRRKASTPLLPDLWRDIGWSMSERSRDSARCDGVRQVWRLGRREKRTRIGRPDSDIRGGSTTHSHAGISSPSLRQIGLDRREPDHVVDSSQ